ncbi:beta-ketoacyl-ACP synthase [Acaryochloris marina]|uniref:Beta-ketoacyl synthase, putative n=1 Tax=Acaryochloris marina (strain MBIC 11017) TaxID=329726 RepID=B0C1V1_ACAM1|nr:beta-ketoacyl-ACP synthase [Acaryochloris marina]ABW26117.1 beta-ketoacyl synthase, putative [Acaryochloris marina MBIC11017]BDM80956.1 3-oxoacyl-ACP synthase [Acaryochloris marina MBIC10699]
MIAKVVVTGMGIVSALAPSLDKTWQRLLCGESGIQHYHPFPEIPAQPLALVGSQPSHLEDLLKPALSEALDDAGLAPPITDCGVAIGSSRGFQFQWEKGASAYHTSIPSYGEERLLLADPEQLVHIYGVSPASIVAQSIAAQGPILAPRAACATGIWAIAQGADLIRAGYCSRVIVGAVEAPITPLTLAGFNKMGAMAQSGAYPFDQNREGFVLGEGAAILVLEEESVAQKRQAKIYGQVLGVGLTVDAYHMTAPETSRRVAITAIQDCLQRSGLKASDVGYIHAHGTATHLNDQAEAVVIKALFPPAVAVSSTKGATGHTLGASAAFGCIFSLMALSHKVLPPCVGLQEPAFDLNFVREPHRHNVQSALCLSSGFGGQNTVLALSS